MMPPPTCSPWRFAATGMWIFPGMVWGPWLIARCWLASRDRLPWNLMAFLDDAHLIADMERLRVHLGVERWLLWGMSWGSTLLLAYAQRFPDRVSEIVISGVTTSRRSEIDWLYRGLHRFFPQEWERFRTGAGEAAADGDLIAAYGRLMADPDPLARARAAADWSAWEDATISLDPDGNPGSYSARPPELLLARARLCAHYFAHAAWLGEGQLLAGAHLLAGIPGVLIQGRMDMGGFDTAWELVRAWPGAELAVIERSGHSGSPEMTARQVKALNDFAGSAARHP